jgi:serine/threonine-protein kinase
MRRFNPDETVDGRYRLVARIGSGGMADVWCAEDEMLGRRVALKFLHERFAQDAEFVERFRREASAAAGLQHPNVVGVFDRGEWEGTHYIAMEYVEGASLKDLIARGLSAGEAVEIVRQVLAGARFAHERGIVHRDLKPQNVLVDRDGRARVTDFGIAKAGVSEITQTGSVLGTAQYLSPEQAQGLEVTARSDLYSIGVILYEALTGRLPFEGDSAVAVALKQVSERPRPPSELNPAIPRALDAVVLRAMAKDPANRFASADEFIAALDAAEADPSGAALGDTAAYAAVAGAAPADVAPAALAPPPPPAEPQRSWFTRNRLLVLGALLLLLGGVAAYALTRPESVLVPTVLEEREAEARAILENAGFEVEVRDAVSGQPVGTVVEQDPRAGEEADEGSTVTISVSRGLGSGTVPSVEGLREREAVDVLRDAGYDVKSRERFSADVPVGRVIGTKPPEGTDLNLGETVLLLVSQGEELVDLPSVIGQQEAIARSTLEDLGFIVDVDTDDSDQAEGTVIGQNPGPGSRLPEGDRVTIIVSSGPGTVAMPDVVGRSRDAAEATLEGRDLSVDVVIQSTDDPAQDDRVTDQAPAPGTRVQRGERVTIFIGRFEAPPNEFPGE